MKFDIIEWKKTEYQRVLGIPMMLKKILSLIFVKVRLPASGEPWSTFIQ
jgi:hypothetical protein